MQQDPTQPAAGRAPGAAEAPAEREFLSGGGETGAQMRAKDWAATPLGPPEAWPTSLKVTVRLALSTHHPMFIFWGPEHLCFYNDAYSLTIGPERHPGALGRPGREVWAEIWDTIGPQIEQVMAGRGATWHEEHLVPITRNGRREEVWWTYGYSPIDDGAGGVGGVLVITRDVTRERLAREALAESEARLAAELQTVSGLHELGTRLLDTPDVAAAAREVLDAVVALAGADRGTVQVYDPALKGLRFVAQRGFDQLALDAIGVICADFHSTCARALRSGACVVVEDFRTDPDAAAHRPTADAMGYRAALSTPLRSRGGEILGMLTMHFREPHSPDERELRLIDLYARQAAHLMERARAEAILRESEARLRDLLATLDLGASMARDIEGMIRFWSEGCARLYGWTAEEAVGRDAHALLRTVFPIPRTEIEAALERDGEWTGDLRQWTRDGRELVVIARKLLRRGPDGRPVAVLEALTDVTAQRRTEEALRRSRAEMERQRRLYEAILTNTPDLGYVFDRNHRFTYANEVLLRMWGKTREEAIGKTCLELGYPEWHAAMHDREIEQVIATRRPIRGEIPFTGTFGRRIYDYIFVPVLGPDGQVEAVAGTTRDVTEHKQIEGALARHRDELERLVEERTAALLRAAEERRRAEEVARQSEKLAALGQLTGGVAHDFGNILQVVSSGVSLLRRPAATEERRAAILDGILQATRNARDLTRRLLAFARQQPLSPEAMDPNARLRGMSELLRHTLGSGIRVETDLAPDLWPVHADPGQFEVAILNLAVNARDAMPEGGRLALRTRNVTLPAAEERAAGGYVRLEVADTGQGIPPAVLARIFEPFFTTKEVGKGTGLGLAQVFGFARQSGGDVQVESEPGRGATVILHLPRLTAQAGPGKEAAPRGAVLDTLCSSEGRVVLVVEDNAVAGDFAAALLEELGYRTRRASGAAEALAMLTDGERVDAVFSDVVMPGGTDGVELASILRASYPQLAVVLTSGYSARFAGGDAPRGVETLPKPYQLDELAAALGRAFAVAPRPGLVETTAE